MNRQEYEASCLYLIQIITRHSVRITNEEDKGLSTFFLSTIFDRKLITGIFRSTAKFSLFLR